MEENKEVVWSARVQIACSLAEAVILGILAWRLYQRKKLRPENCGAKE